MRGLQVSFCWVLNLKNKRNLRRQTRLGDDTDEAPSRKVLSCVTWISCKLGGGCIFLNFHPDPEGNDPI